MEYELNDVTAKFVSSGLLISLVTSRVMSGCRCCGKGATKWGDACTKTIISLNFLQCACPLDIVEPQFVCDNMVYSDKRNLWVPSLYILSWLLEYGLHNKGKPHLINCIQVRWLSDIDRLRTIFWKIRCNRTRTMPICVHTPWKEIHRNRAVIMSYIEPRKSSPWGL